MLQRFRQSLSTRPHSRPHSSTWNARKLERRKPDRPLRLAAVGADHPPLRRVFHVDVLDDIVEALAEHLVAELYVIDTIVLDDRQHPLDHAGQQLAHVIDRKSTGLNSIP